MRAAIPSPLHTECPSIRVAELLGELKTKDLPLPVPFETISSSWKSILE
jgi:hypothetical protein